MKKIIFLFILVCVFIMFGIVPKTALADVNSATTVCKNDMASRLRISASQISIFSAINYDFPNACYECRTGVCLSVISPGYKITLRGGGWEYLYNVDSLDVIQCLKSQTALPTNVPVSVCLRIVGAVNYAVGQCNSNCQAYCPSGYQTCDRNNNGTGSPGSCMVPDISCALQQPDGTRRINSGVCCCPIPTPTPTPTIVPMSCQGQYYGKPQCDSRAPSVYGKGGTCQLNPALGTINLNSPNDSINIWKWSYCKNGNILPTPTVVPTIVPTITPRPTVIPTVVPMSCQGQYYGKPQCDSRGSIAYGKGGTCQLNPALGTINPSNPNDPINTWKWSYCR